MLPERGGQFPGQTSRRVAARRELAGRTVCSHGRPPHALLGLSGSGLGEPPSGLGERRRKGSCVHYKEKKASQPAANGIVCICERLYTMPPRHPRGGQPRSIATWQVRGRQVGKHWLRHPGRLLPSWWCLDNTQLAEGARVCLQGRRLG